MSVVLSLSGMKFWIIHDCVRIISGSREHTTARLSNWSRAPCAVAGAGSTSRTVFLFNRVHVQWLQIYQLSYYFKFNTMYTSHFMTVALGFSFFLLEFSLRFRFLPLFSHSRESNALRRWRDRGRADLFHSLLRHFICAKVKWNKWPKRFQRPINIMKS